MRRSARWISALLIFTIIISDCKAQRAGVGVRIGEPYGLSVKYYFAEANAIEAIIGGRPLGLNLTALYTRHVSAFNMDEFKWFYGGGAHFGFFETRRDYNWWEYSNRLGRPTFGVDAIFGLEFMTPALPISISADYKPAISVAGYPAFLYGDAALTFRWRL